MKMIPTEEERERGRKTFSPESPPFPPLEKEEEEVAEREEDEQ